MPKVAHKKSQVIEGIESLSIIDNDVKDSLRENIEGIQGVKVGELEIISPLDVVPNNPLLVEIKRPSYQTYIDWFQLGDINFKPGLYYHGIDKDGLPFDFFICSPIYADALTCDEHNVGWGLLLRFVNPDGNWREWAMPAYMLKGSGEDVRGQLLDMGVHIDPDAHKRLLRWLANQLPPRRIIAATRTGWHEGREGIAFVLPHISVGANDVHFQSESTIPSDFSQKGTLNNWRREVAGLCRGNSILMLSLSAAFTAPLLKLAKLQEVGGAGLHLMGDSSRGKTTALQVAASVWGAPTFMRTWRSTTNGLEAIAAFRNDSFLPLDEAGESDPAEIGTIIYALANGIGKQRARRSGIIREAARWRIIVLSSGESSISSHMEEGGKRIKAGQAARLLDIPATHFKYGAFECLHEHSNGQAFADSLKQAVSRSYGHAGIMFVEKLIAEQRDLPALYAEICQLEDFCATDGVELRAVSTFALIALAGELATEYGLTGWEKGEAQKAAITAFQSWKEYRGSGKTEDRQILQGIYNFILKYTDSRFSDKEIKPETMAVRERAGWWQMVNGKRIYLFTAPALKEAAPGFDVRKIMDVLEQAGWIVMRDKDKRSKKVNINGQTLGLYHICPNWEEEI
ncbi:DUF927 domain-containing protein [Legionella sp. km535]|uniref:DUF927 domain-containing protein n=1 Tax=Legionella sp. km535 TaxID=2498107 RepID=UPI000F8E29FD|nr:DUF927 domain-containing protein [Legionella sp. km535]RUR15820.1 DUF927 domain-containing protein [Legionella sp. km535]